MKKLKEKKGGTVIILVIMLVILFPLLFSAIVDLSNIYSISKQLKISLNASAKSASSRVDWSKVPNGTFYIDENEANKVFETVFNNNLGIIANKKNNKNFKINSYYTEIYNSYPNKEDFIPKKRNFIINNKIRVDRPTVYAVATIEYKTLLGKKLYISNFAASQLDFIPEK